MYKQIKNKHLLTNSFSYLHTQTSIFTVIINHIYQYFAQIVDISDE